MYGCVTWIPGACHYDTLRQAYRHLLTRCLDWRKNNSTNHPISYLGMRIKTGSEISEEIIRRRWILNFVDFVVRIDDTRLPKCAMFGELVGDAGQKKYWMEYFLDELRAFNINANQWTTAAQDEGEWRNTAKRFMAKWIAAENFRVGLRHTLVCLNVMKRLRKG